MFVIQVVDSSGTYFVGGVEAGARMNVIRTDSKQRALKQGTMEQAAAVVQRLRPPPGSTMTVVPA